MAEENREARSMTPMSVRALVCVLLTACVDPSEHQYDLSEPASVEPLLLEEVASWPSPSTGEPIKGISFRSDGSALAWFESGRILLVGSSEAPEQGPTHLLQVSRLSALASLVEGVVGVDASTGSIQLWRGWRTGPENVVTCPGLEGTRFISAMEFGVFGLSDHAPPTSEGQVPHLYFLAGTSRGCDEIRWIPAPCERALGSSLAGSGNAPEEVILSCGRGPSGLFRVRLEGGEPRIMPIAGSDPSGPGDLNTDTSRWIPLPLVPVPGGYVRMWTDIRSERRRVDRWSEDGVFLRSTDVEGGVGLVAGSPRHRLLVGVHGGTVEEVVLLRVQMWESSGRLPP
jgi:hypothetical protein